MIKRISSSFLALLFIIISTIPVTASSSSEVAYEQPVTASGAIGGTIALSGYLSASGIHLSAAGSSFSDVEIELGSLWDAYKATVQGVKNLAEYTGSVVRGGYVLARDAWNAFGGFGRWLKQKFGLEDNKTGQELVDSTQPVAGNLLTTSWLYLGGEGSWTGSSYKNYGGLCRIRLVNSQLSGVYVFFRPNGQSGSYEGYYVGIYNAGINTVVSGDINVNLADGYDGTISLLSSVLPGHSSLFDNRFQIRLLKYGVPAGVNPDIPIVSGSYVPPEESEPEESILSVDTTDISIPDDIPDTATGSSSLGGIMIPAIGAGVGGVAGAIAAAIINGITDGDLIDTVIRAAEVELPPGLEIGDDGDIFPDVLEIDPSDIFLESDGQIVGDLFDYFPFSIPKTIYQTLLALDAEPITPELQYTIKMPYNISDITIDVDFVIFSSVAAILRSGFYLIFCVGWCKFLYDKLG